MDQEQSVLSSIVTAEAPLLSTRRPPGGWTHHVMVRRPTGHRVYTMWVEVNPGTGQVVRNASPRAM